MIVQNSDIFNSFTDNRAVTVFNVTDIGGGLIFKNGWIHDGKEWNKTAPMSVARSKPACSLVEMDNGEVPIRVELLPAFKFTGKLVKIKEFTGKW